METFGPNGETLLEYSIYDAIRAGFGKIIFIIRHDFKTAFKERIGNKVADSVAVDYVYQDLHSLPEGFSPPTDRTKPWGTGHAIGMARDVINEPFGVINADDFYGKSAYEILYKFLSREQNNDNSNFCLIGYRLGNTLSDFGTVTRGICSVNDDHYLVGLEEHYKIEKTVSGPRSSDSEGNHNALNDDAITSMNLFGFTPAIFNQLDALWVDFLNTQGSEMDSEFLIPVAVDRMIEQGHAKVKVLKTEEKWFGVTYPEDVELVREQLAARVSSGEYPYTLGQDH